MRILHVIGSVDPRLGGPIEGIIRQDAALKELTSGVREIVSLDHPDEAFLRSIPLRVHALGTRLSRGENRGGILTRYGFTPHYLPWLRQNLGNYDCVIVNGLWNYATLGARVSLAGGIKPYLVYTHGMLDPWFRQQYPLKHAMKQLSWLLCEGPLLHNAAAVLFTAEEERRLARGQFVGFGYREAVVGYGSADPPPPSDNQHGAFRALVPSLGQRPYLLFLSRLHPKKGCDILIRAYAKVAARLPDIDLVMAGPDQVSWKHQLQALAQSLGVADRVHWPGMVSGDAKWGAYRGAKAFVLPTHQENFGLVIAEAMACGVPVLTTDKVNIWQDIKRGGGGLIASDEVTSFYGILEEFLAMDEAPREEMGSRARREFERSFTVRAAAEKLVKLIRQSTPASLAVSG